jgi:hypothetical protein
LETTPPSREEGEFWPMSFGGGKIEGGKKMKENVGKCERKKKKNGIGWGKIYVKMIK